MELYWAWVCAATLATCYVLRRLNGWYYDVKLRKKQYPLPPGDMGWPLIGNLIPFYKDFSSGRPNSFINNLLLKYGEGGIYKTHLFGNPSIIVCEPEICMRVLTDDVNFRVGYPTTIKELIRLKHISRAEHKQYRRLVNTLPILDHQALATLYLERIENIVTNSLEELSSMKHPVELLKEMKKVTFKVFIHILMGSSIHHMIIENMDTSFAELTNGILSAPINAPGFVFHKALKARKKLAKILQSVVDERRLRSKNGQEGKDKVFLDNLLEAKDENGRKRDDEYIVDVLIAQLFAGHETSATALMWTILYLTQHPHILEKAKKEQEEIMKARVSSQGRLNLQEIKQMVYLSQVIDETLRCANIVFTTFREAISDVNINGYVIPNGWRVLVWARAVHMNPKYYPNPEEFNPSRWDDYHGKAGTFLPFGAGSRLCPGKDLAKLEISVFLHYFLLNYKLERINAECPITFLPILKPVDNCLAKVIKVS
ncbi:beta-amyrin 11-oxidase-like [Lotus japonicus]|uniref:Cytochrome P450 88D4 n=1 Tax=Lotus japonicus TaxID=34305 RepID=B5BSW9_LOTJA|nr:beta-amyrin 11-oxidase-like [Lotus japonicus]BAG68927.1 cytochrome P450 88D4 [Lotus japonicus]